MRYTCRGCKNTMKGKPEYSLIERSLIEKSDNVNDIIKAGIHLCNACANKILFPE